MLLGLGVASCDDGDSRDPYDPYLYNSSSVIFHVEAYKADSAFLSGVWIEAESGNWVAHAKIDTIRHYDSKTHESSVKVDSSRVTVLVPAFKPMNVHKWESHGAKDEIDYYDARIHMNGNVYQCKLIFNTVPPIGPVSSSLEIVRIKGRTFVAQHVDYAHIGVRITENGECEFFEMDVPEGDW